MDKILPTGLFTFLSEIITCKAFKQDIEPYDAFLGVFHDLIDSFLKCHESYWEQRLQSPFLPNLLSFMSEVYKNEPSYAISYWELKSGSLTHFQHFIRLVGHRISANIYLEYLKLLTSLACGEDCAAQTFLFLKQQPINKLLSWDFFFDIIKKSTFAVIKIFFF